VKAALVAIWHSVILTAIVFPLIAGGLAGAIYTHWVTTRPANIEPATGDYGLLMGKPLLGLPLILPNRGHSPGVVTSIELSLVGETENRRTESKLDSVFSSKDLEIFNVAPSGKLNPAGDLKLSLFVPLTVSAGQTTSAMVWFQPRSRDFLFEGSSYRCSADLIVLSGDKMQKIALRPFRFVIDQDEADALNQSLQKNVLLPVKLERQ